MFKKHYESFQNITLPKKALTSIFFQKLSKYVKISNAMFNLREQMCYDCLENLILSIKRVVFASQARTEKDKEKKKMKNSSNASKQAAMESKADSKGSLAYKGWRARGAWGGWS